MSLSAQVSLLQRMPLYMKYYVLQCIFKEITLKFLLGKKKKSYLVILEYFNCVRLYFK